MQNKFESLKIYLKNLGKQGICLAFSGGIDSTLLLYLCKEINANFITVTFKSEFQSDYEIDLTKKLCEKYNVKQIIEEYDILSNSVIVQNPKDRCYYCKKILFSKAVAIASEYNIKNIIDGTNYNDLNEYRPGLKALSELNIISPFAKFEITKEEIRNFAKEKGIEIFNKPSTPCLATRLPYGNLITKEKLKIIEKGEEYLRNEGFVNNRLRLHDDIARIEIPKDKFFELISKKDKIAVYLKSMGITYVTLDIEGLRSGSMDESLGNG